MAEFTKDSAERVGKATHWVERHNRTEPHMRGRWHGRKYEWEVGKLDETLSFQSSAVMSIWQWNGSAWEDSGENITVYDWLLQSGQTIASGIKVIVGLHRQGIWVVISAECP